MKWFSNLKVAYKVLISCLVFILLIALIAGQGINASNTANETFVKFFDKEFMPIRYLNRIVRNMLQMRINMLMEYEALQTGDWAEIERRMKDSGELEQTNEDRWKKYRESLFSDEGRKLADDWEKL